MIVQIIDNGAVANCVVIPDGATVTSAEATWTGGSFFAPAGATLMSQAGAGIGWTLSGSTLVAPAEAAPTQAQLAASVVSACAAAATAVLGQIYSDSVHQAAGQNAAMIVAASGGSAPASTSPFYAQFGAYATVYGVTPAVLATLVTALTNQSLDLSAALITLETAAAAATTAAQLATALTAFETAIGAVVTAVNAASPPTPLTAPAAISIAGVNA